jgi:hypothetical protein
MSLNLIHDFRFVTLSLEMIKDNSKFITHNLQFITGLG